jgi:hypothetical protein
MSEHSSVIDHQEDGFQYEVFRSGPLAGCGSVTRYHTEGESTVAISQQFIVIDEQFLWLVINGFTTYIIPRNLEKKIASTWL